jgi:hypothetical protein
MISDKIFRSTHGAERKDYYLYYFLLVPGPLHDYSPNVAKGLPISLDNNVN